MNGDSSTLDTLDRALVRCLQVSPRAPFSLFAAVLGTSEQTIARRYRRLHRAGVLRVTAVLRAEGQGQTNWIVRILCKPDGASSLAHALAQREDVGWVSISGGATEVVCAVRSRTAAERENLLLQRLPRSGAVLGVSAAMTLHTFVAERSDDWTGLETELTPAQTRQLRDSSEAVIPSARLGERRELDSIDFAIPDRLVIDGRASYADLAATAGITDGRAARRVASLIERGMAHLDVDLSPSALGWDVQALLWMSASPQHVHGCGEALAALPEVPYAAAVTGPHNLVAAVTCRDHADLYRVITQQIGAITGLQSIEVSPRIRTVKQAGTHVEGDRLAT